MISIQKLENSPVTIDKLLRSSVSCYGKMNEAMNWRAFLKKLTTSMAYWQNHQKQNQN